MNDQYYTTSFTVDHSSSEVFAAINDVRGWWFADVAGDTGVVGSEFAFEGRGVHSCRLRVAELVPNEKVVWRVVDSHMTFVDDPAEWVGTQLRPVHRREPAQSRHNRQG